MNLKSGFHPSTYHLPKWFLALIVIALCLGIGPIQVFAQSQDKESKVQVITGKLKGNDYFVYLLPDLKQDDTLYVYMSATSGNLDPLVMLVYPEHDPKTALEYTAKDYRQAIEAGQDPFTALPEILGKYFIAGDDDSGKGHDAALEYAVPKDGDYRLLVASTPTAGVTKRSFGDFHLLLGLNKPIVLKGKAPASGKPFASIDQETSKAYSAIQEHRGALSEEKPSTSIQLQDFAEGDTLFMHIEAVSGDLIPTIVLMDYSGKPIRSANLTGKETKTSFEYTFQEPARDYLLTVASCCESEPTAGDYRLLAGLNAPEVLEGQGEPNGRPVLRLAIPVYIGIKLQQIVGVDQKAENFDAVASLQMEWTDPALAYNPDDCNCWFKSFPDDSFKSFVEQAEGRWPEFTLFNQQGNRWTQNKIAVVLPDGQVIYLERFTTTFQAPDFDFKQFPFDKQQFYIRVDSIFSEDFYVYKDLEGYTEIGTQLGEEEWIVVDDETIISTEQSSTEAPTSRFSLRFANVRHLDYYIWGFFVPLSLITLVGWITFFLKDYGKRVDVTAGNLLVFIAYRFTIANDLPHLGYQTFMDTILTAIFFISVILIVYNVIIKRMEAAGKHDLARKIDQYAIWGYPLLFGLAIFIVIQMFFY